MWDSKGDVNGWDDREIVDDSPGDMTISGKVDGHSVFTLVSKTGSITVNDRIDGKSAVTLISTKGSITLKNRIDGNSFVFLVSRDSITIDGTLQGNSMLAAESIKGSITITGKIDANCDVRLKADGAITIGTKGGADDKKIDGQATVTALAGGNITVGSYIHDSTVAFSAHGAIVTTEINTNAIVRQIADGDVSVNGHIDGASRVDLVSNRGSVKVDGKIDGSSKVYLTAGKDVGIGVGKQFGDGDHRIDGDSSVVAMANGDIVLGGRIANNRTTVDFAAFGSVSLGQNVTDGAAVRLLSGAGKISLKGPIDGGGTLVTSWPTGALPPPKQQGGGKWQEVDWGADAQPLNAGSARKGYWWENWPQTFGYVAPFRKVPRSLDEIGDAIKGTGNPDAPDRTPVKAIGGGWSFTDASLPFVSEDEVKQASIRLRGAWQRQDLRDVLNGLNNIFVTGLFPTPMDLAPEAVKRNAAFSTKYDPMDLRQATSSGAQLPASAEVRLIDTRSLASSLQCELDLGGIDVPGRPPSPKEILFHVEAGITMADLQQLLDHQHPRLAIQASGGSPGATLAGALSTATHGGEFRPDWPLLVDTVRAVHLVGPGGVQWWIEGDVPVAKPADLFKLYTNLTPGHIINQGWSGIPGLTAQDVLDAVAVSMGTMGVIYSVVLAVVPQYGLHQVIHPTTWTEFLKAAGATVPQLQSGLSSANQAVLAGLMDGKKNGTEIDKKDNVYINLAINPLTNECWITNREVVQIPDDPNIASGGLNDFVTPVSRALARHSVSELSGSKPGGRVWDFFNWGTDIGNFLGHLGMVGKLAGFVSDFPDPLAGLLGVTSVQAILNEIHQSNSPDRGHKFMGDVLTGFFHALEGTQPGRNFEITAVSHKVGAAGWLEGGLPGRGLEIALDEANAFTFLQTVLIDEVIEKMVLQGKRPFFGYISIRVCPPTRTLMGMQQYSPHSVMIEVVAYRSPEANDIMKVIQEKAIGWSGPGPKPLLHWGLENDQVKNSFLKGTPLGQPYKSGFTRLEAFARIREYLKEGNAGVFDNNFTSRIGV